MSACLVVEGGGRIALEVDRWRAGPDSVEFALLNTLPDPVLDVGCGPGRVVGALSAAGRVALGIDPSPAAADEAARRGAPMLQRSVFAPLPGEGRWGTALLLDGNIGIGGDAVALLRRLRTLIRPGGEVVAELASDGLTSSLTVRLEVEGERSPAFKWATVGTGGWSPLALRAGFGPAGVVELGGRWFGRAVRP